MVEIEEHKQLFSKSPEEIQLLCLALSEMTIVRKMFYDCLQKTDVVEEKLIDSFNYSSPKLKQLLNVLSNVKPSDVCLILVNDQISAKILYHYINVRIPLIVNSNKIKT